MDWSNYYPTSQFHHFLRVFDALDHVAQCTPTLWDSCVTLGRKSVPHNVGLLCYTGEKERSPHRGTPVLHWEQRAYPTLWDSCVTLGR